MAAFATMALAEARCKTKQSGTGDGTWIQAHSQRTLAVSFQCASSDTQRQRTQSMAAGSPLPTMPQLKGKCNQCGLCCMVGDTRCIHLEVRAAPGEPMATRCTVYDRRVKGMPIMLVDPQGNVVNIANCVFDAPEETAVIIERGIGKGCSLELVS